MLCNCQIKNKCPLNKKCLVENVIYKATISSAKESKNYLGSTGGTFKKDCITTSVTSKLTKKTVQNCQNMSGNSKVTILTLK